VELGDFFKMMVMMMKEMEKMRTVKMTTQSFRMKKMIALRMMMNQISQEMTMMMIMDRTKMLKRIVKVLVGMN
jgi:fido (protein-threonine AMPylation protein)